VRRQEGRITDRVVDVGCGRGVDALWFAGKGVPALGLDYVTRGSRAVAEVAAERGVDLEFRQLNLCELRSVLCEGARVARLPGRTIVTARNIAEATDGVGRRHLWRVCEMMLRGGGRLYLEFLVARGDGDPFARRNHLRTLPVQLVEAELAERGATVVAKRLRRVKSPDVRTGHRICRMVVEWQR
jgi:hypothetical protein